MVRGDPFSHNFANIRCLLLFYQVLLFHRLELQLGGRRERWDIRSFLVFGRRCYIESKHAFVVDKDFRGKPFNDPRVLQSFKRSNSLVRVPKQALVNEV